MLNYRVDDLDALLEALRAEGVEVDPKREDPNTANSLGSPIPRETRSSCGSRRKSGDQNVTNARRAEGLGIARSAKEPAMAANAPNAPERADARTARAPAATREKPAG